MDREKEPKRARAITRADALPDLPYLLTVEEFCTWAHTGRTMVYDLIRQGVLPHVRFGRVIRIPRSGLEAYLSAQQAQPSDGTRDDHR
jgi:excisionase family DNA binding protein